MKKFIILAFLLQSAFAERIINTQNGEIISRQQLAEALSRAQIVLVGEEHDNLQHHQAQEWLFQQTANGRASVVLEMLMPEQEEFMREMQAYLLDGGDSGKRSLAQKINWNMSWDWSQYQALIASLLRQKALLLAGSPSKNELIQQSAFIPSGAKAGNIAVRQNLAQLINAHHGDSANLVAMQQYKDFYMSQVLLRAPKPAWLIAGNIHISKQLGVPLFLADAHFADSVKTLLLTTEGSEVDKQHADYLWFF